MELFNFIGGEFVASMSKNIFIKKSPFDGSELAKVFHAEALDVVRAIQLSKKSLAEGDNRSTLDRAKLLLDLANHLEKNADRYAHAEALHQGLPKKFVLENSILVSIDLLRRNAVSLQEELPKSVYLQASGIVGIITPWCLSLRLITERLAPAIAAGNAVIVKVSELSPITAQILGECLQAIEAPIGLVQVIQGGSNVAQLIAGHPSIRAITAVGRQSTLESVAKIGTSHLKKIQLSGGAKNSAIVLSDFSYKERMSEILESFLIGQGQMCWNTSRLFLPESIYKDFMEVMQATLSDLHPLQSPEGSSAWTPMIAEGRDSQIASYTKEGISEHGKVFFGGHAAQAEGFFLEPTFMIDLPNCSTMQQDELYGPLVLVTPVKYQHEAVKWTNTSYLGHSAVVWGLEEKIDKIASKLECAQVWRNSWMQGSSNIIFGHKQSSFGNLDCSWSGTFYSDVKKLTGP